MSDSLRVHGLYSPWNSPGKNTGVGCYALLQGIFLIQGSNSLLIYLQHQQAGSLPQHHLGSPKLFCRYLQNDYKIYKERQSTQKSQHNTVKQSWKTPLPSFKTQYKAVTVKRICYLFSKWFWESWTAIYKSASQNTSSHIDKNKLKMV